MSPPLLLIRAWSPQTWLSKLHQTNIRRLWWQTCLFLPLKSRALNSILRDKKKENNVLTLEKQSLDARVTDLQRRNDKRQTDLGSKDKVISNLKEQHAKELEDLKKQHLVEVENLKKQFSSELDEPKGQHSTELNAAEQKGYDTGYLELSAELEIFRAVCYQVGYNLGLDVMGATSDSEHRHSVSLPEGFEVADHLPADFQTPLAAVPSSSAPPPAAPTSEDPFPEDNAPTEMNEDP